MRGRLPSSARNESASKPKAAPVSAQHRSSTTSASIAPLTPPAGSIMPSSAALASVVGLAFAIHRPALRNRLAFARRHHQLAARDFRQRQVDDQRRARRARKDGSDRIGAEDRPPAAPAGIAAGEFPKARPTMPVARDRREVPGGDAEVVAAGHAGEGGAASAGALDRFAHRQRAGRKGKAVGGIDQAGAPAFAQPPAAPRRRRRGRSSGGPRTARHGTAPCDDMPSASAATSAAAVAACHGGACAGTRQAGGDQVPRVPAGQSGHGFSVDAGASAGAKESGDLLGDQGC